MIVKKADEEGTTTNADDWGIETDFDLLNNSDLNGFQLDPPLTSNCIMDTWNFMKLMKFTISSISDNRRESGGTSDG